MKQHINKKQWDELSNKQKAIWVDFDFEFDFKGGVYCLMMMDGKDSVVVPTIGRMIEFLGDSLWFITNELERGCEVILKYTKDKEEKQVIFSERLLALNDDRLNYLCDALWEAVKFKLKNAH